MAISPTIREYLLKVRKDMIAEQQAKGIYLTGRSADSLRIVGSRARGAVLEGIGYWNFLFSGQGRKPGKFPPFRKILEWVQRRRLQARRPNGRFQTYKQTAFLVSRKIAQEGTGIYQNSSKGVNLQRILKKHEPFLVDGVGTEIQQTLIKDINKVIIG